MPGILDFLATFGRSMLAENMPPPVKAAMAIAEYAFRAKKELTWAQKWMKYGYVPLLPTLTTKTPSGTTYQEQADTPALFFVILFFFLAMATMGMIFYRTQRLRIHAAVARETTRAWAYALPIFEPVVKTTKRKFSIVGNVLLTPWRVLVFVITGAIHTMQWIYRAIRSVKNHILTVYNESVSSLMLRNQERRERIRQLQETAVDNADLVESLQQAMPDVFHGAHNLMRKRIWDLRDFLQLFGTLDLERDKDILIELIFARDTLDELRETLPYMFERDNCVNLRAKELKKLLECLGTNSFKEGTKRIKQLQADREAFEKLREERPKAFTVSLEEMRSKMPKTIDKPKYKSSIRRLLEMVPKTADLPKPKVSTTILEDLRSRMSDMVTLADFQRGKFGPAFREPQEEDIRDQLDILVAIYADMNVQSGDDALASLARLKEDHDMMSSLREVYPLHFDGDRDHVLLQLSSLFRHLDDALDLRPCSDHNDSALEQVRTFYLAKFASFLQALGVDQAKQIWTQKEEEHLFKLVAGTSNCEVEHTSEGTLRYFFGHCRHHRGTANVVSLPPPTSLDFPSLFVKKLPTSSAKPTGHTRNPQISDPKSEGSSGGHKFPKSDQEEDEQLQEALRLSRNAR